MRNTRGRLAAAEHRLRQRTKPETDEYPSGTPEELEARLYDVLAMMKEEPNPDAAELAEIAELDEFLRARARGTAT